MNEKPYAWPNLADNASALPSPAKFEPFFQSENANHERDFSSIMQHKTTALPAECQNRSEPASLHLLHEKIAELESTVINNEKELAQRESTINLFNEVIVAQNAHISDLSKQILLQVLKTNSPKISMSFNAAIWLHALECLREKLGTDEFCILIHGSNLSNIELQAQKLFSNQKYTIIADESLPLDEIHVEYQESRTAASISDISDQLIKIIEERE